jgi:hypothetical protein
MFSKREFIKKSMNKIIVGLHLHLLKEGDYYIVYCPALELTSYGETEDIAKKRFDEEMSIFFNETNRKGTLEKYLLKMGWTLTQKPKPKYSPPEHLHIPLNQLNSFTERVSIPV